MTDNPALLAAIAANPGDDLPRLVYADWLDENGQTERAEFIRLQIHLGSANRIAPRYAKEAKREKELLDSHAAEWLGPLHELKYHSEFEDHFRRGFVQSLTINGSDLAKYGAVIATACPVLDTLNVVGVRNHGKEIAGLTALQSVRTLCLEDWPFPDDIRALADSAHFTRLERLSVWIGSQNDEAVCRLINSTSNVPSLKRVELVQLYGGMQAGDQAEELHQRADELTAHISQRRPNLRAVVDRPFETLLPLTGAVGRNFYAGTLAEGQPVLVNGRRVCEVFRFDTDGRLLRAETHDLNSGLVRTPLFRFQDHNDEELLEILRDRFGFQLGTIRVHEFDAGAVIPDHYLAVYKLGGSAVEVAMNPDQVSQYIADDWEGNLAHIRYFLRTDNFCLTAADECWLDSRGHIHST